MYRSMVTLGLSAAVVGLVTGARAADAPKVVAPPDITGAWTGTWGPYLDPNAPAPKKPAFPPMKIDCKVEKAADGKWGATFEGNAGGFYKYSIKLTGRQSGNVVLFQGTEDLGEKGGGIYDWIGRANETEFMGFYTSQGHVGTFHLTKVK